MGSRHAAAFVLPAGSVARGDGANDCMGRHGSRPHSKNIGNVAATWSAAPCGGAAAAGAVRAVPPTASAMSIPDETPAAVTTLPSMIIGEPQIGGQVKSAFHHAHELGTLDSLLQQVFVTTGQAQQIGEAYKQQWQSMANMFALVPEAQGKVSFNVQPAAKTVDAAGSNGPIEVIVVSDGSFDRTDELVLESELADVRAFWQDLVALAIFATVMLAVASVRLSREWA